LRVRVPRDRPGIPPPKAALDWPKLRHLASFRPLTVASPARDGVSTPG